MYKKIILFSVSILVGGAPVSLYAMRRSPTGLGTMAKEGDLVSRRRCVPEGESIEELASAATGVKDLIKSNARYWSREEHLQEGILRFVFQEIVTLLKRLHVRNNCHFDDRRRFDHLWDCFTNCLGLFARKLKQPAFGAWGVQLADALGVMVGWSHHEEVFFSDAWFVKPKPAESEAAVEALLGRWNDLYRATLMINRMCWKVEHGAMKRLLRATIDLKRFFLERPWCEAFRLRFEKAICSLCQEGLKRYKDNEAARRWLFLLCTVAEWRTTDEIVDLSSDSPRAVKVLPTCSEEDGEESDRD